MINVRKIAAGLSPILAVLAPGVALAAHTINFGAQTEGPTPFIEHVSLNVTGSKQLTSVQFTITPKQGSVTRPISATYSAAYLIARGYWDGAKENMRIPVFGLYAGTTNAVTFQFSFSDSAPVPASLPITAAPYTDSCNVLNNRKVIVQARNATADLSFDYILLKKYCDTTAPTLLDTDGEVRWIGDGKTKAFASAFFQNGFYVSNVRGAIRIEFDGTKRVVGKYTDIGVTSTNHHNFDPGRTGLVMDVNTTTQTEAVNIEIDGTGKVLNTWDFSQIISKAMLAGGDDPTKFVSSGTDDWFHNNASTYNPADNTLIVSSRENFVIAVDYDTQKIKWILGDHTKHWFQFKSLRKFSLDMPPGTLPPIGQHAVSLDHDGNLLLIDDGLKSMFQVPPGKSRSYTSPRAYHIDTTAMTATEVYQNTQHQMIYSPICSSVYEDAPNNYLVDYSVSQGETVMELVGLSPLKKKIFDYQYPAVNFCSAGWNAQVIHLENLQF